MPQSSSLDVRRAYAQPLRAPPHAPHKRLDLAGVAATAFDYLSRGLPRPSVCGDHAIMSALAHYSCRLIPSLTSILPRLPVLRCPTSILHNRSIPIPSPLREHCDKVKTFLERSFKELTRPRLSSASPVGAWLPASCSAFRPAPFACTSDAPRLFHQRLGADLTRLTATGSKPIGARAVKVAREQIRNVWAAQPSAAPTRPRLWRPVTQLPASSPRCRLWRALRRALFLPWPPTTGAKFAAVRPRMGRFRGFNTAHSHEVCGRGARLLLRNET